MKFRRGKSAEIEALTEENRRLKRAVDELGILNDLAREIGGSFDMERVIDTIVRRSLHAVGAAQGVVTLVERRPAEDLMHTLVRANLTSTTVRPAFHFDRSLLGWMLLHREPLLTNAPRDDERFRGVRWNEAIVSLLAVPLMIKSEVTGVLAVYNKKAGGGFDEEDRRILSIIAAQSAQIVENARLHEEEKALLHVKEEIRFASEIQERLLPERSPSVEGYDIAALSRPAHGVGGDYFDFIPVEGGRLALCLGDVTGKGLPAALLMANLQATIRGQTLAGGTPSACMARANRLLFASTDPVKFATLFYAVLDPAGHRLCHCSAGHDRPYLFSGNAVRRLDAGGMMLGAMEGQPYEHACVDLAPGDLLVVYSDGITEAMAPGGGEAGEEFGEGRLGSLLEEHRTKRAGELIELVLGAVEAHAAGREQSDDMTLLVLRREA